MFDRPPRSCQTNTTGCPLLLLLLLLLLREDLRVPTQVSIGSAAAAAVVAHGLEVGERPTKRVSGGVVNA